MIPDDNNYLSLVNTLFVENFRERNFKRSFNSKIGFINSTKKVVFPEIYIPGFLYSITQIRPFEHSNGKPLLWFVEFQKCTC